MLHRITWVRRDLLKFPVYACLEGQLPQPPWILFQGLTTIMWKRFPDTCNWNRPLPFWCALLRKVWLHLPFALPVGSWAIRSPAPFSLLLLRLNKPSTRPFLMWCRWLVCTHFNDTCVPSASHMPDWYRCLKSGPSGRSTKCTWFPCCLCLKLLETRTVLSWSSRDTMSYKTVVSAELGVRLRWM